MGKYVENHLSSNEKIIYKGRISYITIITSIFRLRLIRNLIDIFTTELAITNKKVIGKRGFINSASMDSALDKVQNVAVKSGLFGKIFNYGDITITTAAGSYHFFNIAKAETFKQRLNAQIEQYSEDKVKSQAAEMAKAMAGALNR